MTTPENTPPPVEELIGWEPHHEPWADASGLPLDGWWDGRAHRASATVDDLAGWLWREVGWSGDWEHDDRGRTFVMTYDRQGQQTGAWVGDAILAALEAAVRAVHEQENTR